MNFLNFTKICVIFTCLNSMNAFSQSDVNTTIGVGAGINYSGLGLNIGLHDTANSYLASAGCISYSTRYGSTCGVGVTWLSSFFFRSLDNSNQHTTTLYLGIVDSEIVLRDKYIEDRAIYGASLGYVYFFNGRASNGLNLGFSVSYGNAKKDSNIDAIFQVGYQF